MVILLKRILLIVMAMLLAGVVTAAQADTLQAIRDRGTVSIGVHTAHKPFGFINEQGKNAGLEIDISRYIALKLLGSTDAVHFVPVQPANRVPYLKRNRVDMVIATFSITPKRSEVIDFSRHYYASGAALLAPKTADVAAWSDLKGKKVCGLQGDYYNPHLSKMGLKMVNFPDTATAYKALKANRCVGFAFDTAQLVGQLRQPWWHKHYHLATPTIMVTPMGIGVRKGNDALRKTLNRIILQMQASGYIYALQTKWGIPHTQFVVDRMHEARKKLGMDEHKSSDK